MDSTTGRKDKAPNPVDVHVGARVKLRRMMVGMSQERLGEHLGLTFQQIQKYEKGANRIGASRLYAIAQILETPIQFFFDEMPSPGPGLEGEEDMVSVSGFVATNEGLELNLAFARIRDPATRRHLADLVRSVADGSGGDDEDAPADARGAKARDTADGG
ncbi:MAG: helix-turn-helix domain-containing protein [Pseudomonadota bacterium]